MGEMEGVWQAMLDRHEVLRSRFPVLVEKLAAR